MPANGNNGRFTLSLAPVNFSLTDGTDIPPPPESPVEEKPPAAAASPLPVAAKASSSPSPENVAIPSSPPIRRFLSRKSLNTNHTSGSNENLSIMTRPDSRNDRPGLKAKKSSSWFKKFSSSERKNRNSLLVLPESKEQIPQPAKPAEKGPPPPKLPELKMLGKYDEGSLGGGDMFRDIK